MVYNKAYDNGCITGSVIATNIVTNEAVPMGVLAGVVDKKRFVDLAVCGITLRMSIEDAQDLCGAFARAAQEATTMPEVSLKGPIYMDKEGSLYE